MILTVSNSTITVLLLIPIGFMNFVTNINQMVLLNHSCVKAEQTLSAGMKIASKDSAK